MIGFLRENLLYGNEPVKGSKPLVGKSKTKKKNKEKEKSGFLFRPGMGVNPFDENTFDQPFEIHAANFSSIGERDLALATSRMGKSNLIGVMLEQYLDQKGIACILDPQSEWFTLQDAYPAVVVGGNIQGRRDYFMADKDMGAGKKKLRLEQLDKRIPLTFKDSDYKPHAGMDKEYKQALGERRERDLRELELLINNLVRGMLTKGFTLIFDLSGHIKPSDKQFIAVIVIEALRRHNNSMRRKMKLVADEVHNFAPQRGGCLSSEYLIDVLKQGAKEGIDFMGATQSCASLDKEIVKQCNRFWLGGVREQNDVNAIANFFGKGGNVTEHHVKALKQFHFYYLFEGKAIKFKPFLRKCEHGGKTPAFKDDAPVATAEDLDTFIQNLKM